MKVGVGDIFGNPQGWMNPKPVKIEKVPVGRWQHDGHGEFPVEHEYFVYEGEKLVRVCPSEGMAREVAAGLGGAA